MFASNFIGPSIADDICTGGAALVFLCVLGMDLLANGDPLDILSALLPCTNQ